MALEVCRTQLCSLTINHCLTSAAWNGLGKGCVLTNADTLFPDENVLHRVVMGATLFRP